MSNLGGWQLMDHLPDMLLLLFAGGLIGRLARLATGVLVHPELSGAVAASWPQKLIYLSRQFFSLQPASNDYLKFLPPAGYGLEIGGALAALLLFFSPLPIWLGLGLLWLVLLVVVIDLYHTIIPDVVNAALLFLGLLAAYLGDVGLLQGFLTALGLLVFSYLLRAAASHWLQREAMGLGDVKFFAAAGAWIGLAPMPVFLLGAGLLGIIFALLWQRATGGREFPFGPALAVALYITVLFPILSDPFRL